jgi:hypothetical protein
MKAIVTSTVPNSKHLHLKEIVSLTLEKGLPVEHRTETPRVVRVNGINMMFLYDPTAQRLYAEYVDEDAMEKQTNDHEAMTEEERKEAGLIDYIERHEWIITY